MRWTMFTRGRGKGARSVGSDPRRQGRPTVAERLEPRTLLSVSADALVGANLVTGNTWTYAVTNDNQTVTSTTTVKGPTEFNGRTVVELDMNQSKSYVGLDGNGNYVSYGAFVQVGSTITQSSVFSPFMIGLPASMSAGVTYSFDHTEVSTQTVGGVPRAPDTDRVNVKLTLATETPQPVTVAAGTFDAYKVSSVETITFGDGGGTDVSTSDQWYAPGVGLVQSTDSTGNVYKLTDFSAQQDHLVFSQQPTATDAGVAIDPPVAVTVVDAAGNPDPDATGTVTLSLADFPRAGKGTLAGTLTRPLSGGVAVFDDLLIDKNGGYQLHAESTAAGVSGITSNKFRVGPSTLAFEINARPTGKGKKGVRSGDVIFYSVLVRPKLLVESQTITIDLPDGFVPNNLTGGATFSGRTITCTVPTARAINFDVTVPDAKTLTRSLAGATEILLTGNADLVYADGSDDAGTAASEVKVAIDRTVTGVLKDALFQFPRRNDVPTSRGLANVQVELVDEAGTTVATAKTAKSGAFTVQALAGGTYAVVLSALADAYDSAADGLTARRVYVGRTVTLEQANTVPIDLGTPVLPLTFLNTAAGLLRAMNHYTTSGFQGLSAFNLDLFRFDTTAAEAALAALAGSRATPTAPMDPASLRPGTATDPWVAAMRMVAGLAAVHGRFTDTFRLADQAGKILAVMASAEFSKTVGKQTASLNKRFPTQPKWLTTADPTAAKQKAAQQKLSQAARVAGFTLLGSVLSPALDKVGVTGERKAAVMAVTFNVLRYATDLVTGKLADDLSFELVFNLVRVTFDVALLKTLTGVGVRADVPAPYNVVASVANGIGDAVGFRPGGTMQGVIDSLVADRLKYDPATDTTAVLVALADHDDFYHNAAAYFTAATASFNSISGIVRGGSGALALQEVAGRIDPAALDGRAFQSRMNTALKTFDSLVNKYTFGSTKQLQARLQIATFASAAASIVQQLVGAARVPDVAATAAWAQPTAAAAAAGTARMIAASAPGDPSPAVTPVATPQAATPLAAAVTPADAYLADLAGIAALVKKKDVDGIDAVYAQFVTDDRAVFDDLTALAAQANAVGPELAEGGDAVVGRFVAAVAKAVNATFVAQSQLDVWGVDPATGNAKAVTGAFGKAAAAVRAAAALADAVRPLLAGTTVPPTLAVEPADVPDRLAPGGTAT
ncbi:MAG TPA: carboxypeptidase-like regulatory domain-containing protein, partial [Humisphaera sp.]